MTRWRSIVASLLALSLYAAASHGVQAADGPFVLAMSGSSACSQPDRPATVTKVARPVYPLGYGNLDRMVLVAVEVSSTGALAASHIFRSSGIPEMDQAALDSARQSTYSAKMVDCTPVAAAYIFHVEFAPADSIRTPGAKAWESTAWDNPFCNASAELVPWNLALNRYADEASDAYVLFVRAHAKENYAVRVTMVSGDSVYQLELPRTPSTGGSEKPYLVSFDKTVGIEYYFVDGAGVDGQPITDCPSFVRPMQPAAQSSDLPQFAMSDTSHADARYLQPLPSLPCGSMYTSPEENRSYEPIVGHYGDRPLSAEVRVYLDSDGRVVRSEIQRSSGVDGIDEAALSAVQYTTYRAATFLCTPVVSVQLITVRYDP